MQYLSIDYLIVYAFLAVILFIGLLAGRGVKDVREYVVANKSFGTGALVLTYLATNIAGASVLNGIAYMFSEGIIILLALSGLNHCFFDTCLFYCSQSCLFYQLYDHGRSHGNAL